MSVDKVLDIARTKTTNKVRLPQTRQTISRTMLITDRHKSIFCLFDEDFWKNDRLKMVLDLLSGFSKIDFP